MEQENKRGPGRPQMPPRYMLRLMLPMEFAPKIIKEIGVIMEKYTKTRLNDGQLAKEREEARLQAEANLTKAKETAAEFAGQGMKNWQILLELQKSGCKTKRGRPFSQQNQVAKLLE